MNPCTMLSFGKGITKCCKKSSPSFWQFGKLKGMRTSTGNSKKFEAKIELKTIFFYMQLLRKQYFHLTKKIIGTMQKLDFLKGTVHLPLVLVLYCVLKTMIYYGDTSDFSSFPFDVFNTVNTASWSCLA